MNHRALLLTALPMFTAAMSGCYDDPTCPYGQVLVHDGNSRGAGVCVYPSRGYGGSSTTPTQDAGSTSHEATPAVAGAVDAGGGGDTPYDSGTTAPSGAAACGGYDAQGDSVRVVDKSDLPPALNDVPPNVADGTYALVQATFFRSGQAATPVKSLRAALQVHGATLAISSQDTSVPGLPKESNSFLVGGGAVTKTCESTHGTVAAWFFPMAVGGTATTHMEFDGASGFLRIIVDRTGGSTELVFAR